MQKIDWQLYKFQTQGDSQFLPKGMIVFQMFSKFEDNPWKSKLTGPNCNFAPMLMNGAYKAWFLHFYKTDFQK